MCDPATLTTMAAIGSLVGTGVGAVTSMMGKSQSSQAASDAAAYNAQVATNNQIIAQNNANTLLQQGQVAEDATRQKTAQMIGAVVDNAAARGVDVNSGSALDIRSSAAETGELDALTIRSNYKVQSDNYLAAAYNYGSQSSLYSAESENASKAGSYDMASSLIGGASSVADKWLTYNQKGLLS